MNNHPDWIWMPHPGHLIVCHSCMFRLNTWVPGGKNGWIVSTVGEYKGPGMGGDPFSPPFDTVQIGLLYQTMVFRAEPSDVPCCPYIAASDTEYMSGYNDPADARHGHIGVCAEWHGRVVETE